MTPRQLLIFLFLLISPLGVTLAQSPTDTPTPTETSTPTETPTPTVTPTPDYRGLVPVGSIQLFAGTSAPSAYWLPCDGSEVSRETYALLFDVIGITFGEGDGSTTFLLPDFRGRVPVGGGAGPDLSTRVPGQVLGEEQHVLTIDEMPVHDHDLNPLGLGIYQLRFSGSGSSVFSSSGSGRPTINDVSKTGTNGGGQAHNNMQPSLVVDYYIWSGEASVFGGSGGGVLDYPTPDGVTAYATVSYDGMDQPVAIRYEVTAGDVIIAILLFLLCGMTILKMVLASRRAQV